MGGLTGSQHDSGDLSALTAREREILVYIGRGWSLPEIAKKLHRSLKTIQTHRQSLGQKLNAGNRVELARIAIEAGLVPVRQSVPYRTLVEALPNGLALADTEGVIGYVNEQMTDLLGYTPDEIVGRPATDFMSEESANRFRAMREQRQRDELQPYRLTLVHKDGHHVAVRITPRSLFDEDGTFKGSFGLVHRISDEDK